MQYYDQREKTLKRIIKTISIILVTILCIVGIFFLINLKKSEQNTISISEQQEQQRMLALRPLYEEKSKLEKQLSDITYKRRHAVDRSPVIIPLLTDCSKYLIHEVSSIFQQYDYPAVICISDTYYPGAEGCISVEEARKLINYRWEFMVDISSNVDKLTELLLSSGLTKPVAIYSPNTDEHNEKTNFDLPVVYYGNQSDKSLFNAVYGIQADELFYAVETAVYDKKAVIMTGGSILPREMYDETLISGFLTYSEFIGAGQNVLICTYSENAALQTQYNQQQKKVIDETEAEYQSITEELRNTEAQIRKIETGLLK